MHPKQERKHFIDWIRVIAFILLILFHSTMPFVNHGWEVKNVDRSELLTSFIWWFYQWRLPLLFFICGAGIYFSLQNRTLFSFYLERFRRLLIPLLFAMFFTIPLQVYVEYAQIGRIHTDYFSFYPSVWELNPYPAGTLIWSHMWFVVYLLAFIIVLLPFFIITKIKLFKKVQIANANFQAYSLATLTLIVPLLYLYNSLFIRYPELGS